jgi:PKD repeat protein
MKRKLLLCFVVSICLSFVSFSQITLNTNNFPVGGLLISRGYVAAVSNVLGNAGPNQFYDFTNIVPVMHDSIKYHLASQTPWAAQHPGATIVYAEKAGNLNYVYYCTSSAYAFCRTGITIIGDFGQGWDTVHGNYTDTDSLITHQYTYGHSEIERAVAVIPNILPFVDFKTRVKRNVLVDGWGHMQTPLNTYTDVLRVKYAQYTYDTATSFGTVVYTAADTQYFYNYYAKDVRHPVVTAHTDKFYNLVYFEYIYTPPVVLGCTDPTAVNYNPWATQSDGSCVYCNINYTLTPDTTICEGALVTLHVSGGSSWLWSDSSTAASLTVNPSETTVYGVYISDGSGCHVQGSVKVSVDKPVTAEFWTTLDHFNMNEEIQFINLSENASVYLWDFDDAVNGSSMLQYPLHTYTTAGMKYVTLIASNTCFADTLMDSLRIIDNTSVNENQAKIGPNIYPNPGNSNMTIDGHVDGSEIIEMTAFDLLGRRNFLARHEVWGDYNIKVNVEPLPPGMYIVEIKTGSEIFLTKWIKTQ